MTLKFPRWLPQNVALHCHAKLNSGALSEEQEKCIIRLATHQNMRPVWETLEKAVLKSEYPDSSKLVNLVEDVRLHPLILYPKAETKKLSAATRRKPLKAISNSSQSLLAAFGHFDPLNQDANSGIALFQAELSRIQNQAASQEEGDKVIKLRDYLDQLEAIEKSGII